MHLCLASRHAFEFIVSYVNPKTIFIFNFSLFVYLGRYNSPSPALAQPTPTKQILSYRYHFSNEENLDHAQIIMLINCYNILHTFIFAVQLFVLIRLSYLHLCNHVRYVTFNTNLNLHRKNKTRKSLLNIWTFLSLVMLGLLLAECERDQILLFIIYINPNFGIAIDLVLKFYKTISWVISGTMTIYIFSIAVTPTACILCLTVMQIWCHSLTRNVPHWLPLIMLSNDIQLNPGPHFQNNFFNFMSWNLNSLTKENFKRVRLIEAHNSIFNYDLISICETSLK